MLLFKRPKKPRDFATSVRSAEQVLRRQIKKRLEPVFDDSLWKRHKAIFMAAQHDKCGYCEVISVNHPGSVEHYAPKSRVEELTEHGSEDAPGTSIIGRGTRLACQGGYWWLAYSWENWLFACERCNTGWKRCLFPVQQSPRANPPRRGARETWLLLDPFGAIDPVEHLDFDCLGKVVARDSSARGAATIRTCGLDRESLRRVRQRTAFPVHRHIDRLLDALKENDLRRALDAVDDLLSLGDEKCAHAGMVRAIVLSKLSLTWTALQRFRAQLSVRARRVVGQRSAGSVGLPPVDPRRYGVGRR